MWDMLYRVLNIIGIMLTSSKLYDRFFEILQVNIRQIFKYNRHTIVTVLYRVSQNYGLNVSILNGTCCTWWAIENTTLYFRLSFFVSGSILTILLSLNRQFNKLQKSHDKITDSLKFKMAHANENSLHLRSFFFSIKTY